MEIKNENVAQLVGKLVELKTIWFSHEQAVYEGVIQVIRDSGVVDLIPILCNDISNVTLNSFVTIVGQFRSRDIPKPDGRLKVQLYVYVKDIKLAEEKIYKNNIEMTGYVCKHPSLRNTPSGKQVADLLVACNYSKDKTAYIPVIAWGREARKSGKYPVGTQVKVSGRLQSRKYTKQVDDRIEEYIAYELSANHINAIDESV